MTRTHSRPSSAAGTTGWSQPYLARAGRRVQVFEARSELGGAVASREVFDGVAARLSRFSYLVSLLPASIIDELGLRLERVHVALGPTRPSEGGLLIERRGRTYHA